MRVAPRELLGFESPRGLMPVTIEELKGGTETGRGPGMRAPHSSPFVYFTVNYALKILAHLKREDSNILNTNLCF
jgi:hypothetical protein